MGSDKKQSEGQHEQTGVRLDKWLWAARFFKTRNLAKQAVEGGKVHYQGQRTKPSKEVQLGATITLRHGHDEWTLVVTGLSEDRRGAPEARLLFEETQTSRQQREQAKDERQMANKAGPPNPKRRPDKKERRKLREFKG